MKNIRIEIKWAIIFVVAQLLWMLLEKLVGLHSTHIDKHAIYTNFFGIIAIVIYVFALLDKRKNFYNGVMTYQQGFITGLIITAIVTVLTPLVQYIISTVITPEYFSNVIKYTVDSGAMNQEAAEQFFNLQSYMIQATIGAAIMGVITSAIVAIFTRKKA
ncbi:MAG: DUF4199 domain-containing protein [Bacteroidota bacterium]